MEATAQRRLVLIRHAKAGDGMIDHERPLARRGERDAERVGGWLVDHSGVPELALVSTALRTRQTWAGIAARIESASGETVAATYERRIYAATVDDLIDVIREVPPAMTTIALVGHSPSVPLCALYLDDSGGAGLLPP